MCFKIRSLLRGGVSSRLNKSAFCHARVHAFTSECRPYTQASNVKKTCLRKLLLGMTLVQAQYLGHLLFVCVSVMPVQPVHKCLSLLCVQHVIPA